MIVFKFIRMGPYFGRMCRGAQIRRGADLLRHLLGAVCVRIVSLVPSLAVVCGSGWGTYIDREMPFGGG
jgi:hypothetical protein